jgi:hypothetical protein
MELRNNAELTILLFFPRITILSDFGQADYTLQSVPCNIDFFNVSVSCVFDTFPLCPRHPLDCPRPAHKLVGIANAHLRTKSLCLQFNLNPSGLINGRYCCGG